MRGDDDEPDEPSSMSMMTPYQAHNSDISIASGRPGDPGVSRWHHRRPEPAIARAPALRSRPKTECGMAAWRRERRHAILGQASQK